MKPTSDPWSFFDKIYCISIDTRIDRRTEAKKQFSSCGLQERVEFIIVGKHPHNQEQGIFESHIHCLQKGLAAGAARILIFEDDILLKNYTPSRLCEATDFLRSTPHWDAFFLGAISSRSEKTANENVVAIKYRCLAHAYCLSRDFAQRMVRLQWDKIPYDTLLQQQCRKSYALSTMIAFQSSSPTDNQTVMLDRMRRFCGGLPFIQRANEFFQRHRAAILCAHLAAILLVVLFVMTQ